MANAGVNKALVKQARDALLARGLRPTIDNVRIELGNTGSKSTIQRYLKELLNQPRPDPTPSLIQELEHLLLPVAERLQAAAEDAIITQREALAREQEAFRHQRQLQVERIQQLQEQVSQLKQLAQEQREREHLLLNQQQQGEVEIRRLLQADTNAQLLLEERAAQLRSLEEKLRHARDSLEHYRQHQQELRTQELSRHEAQLQQLQKELRIVRDQLMNQQNDVVALNRANERLIAEAQVLTQREFEKERELRELHAQLEQSQAAWNTEQAHLQRARLDAEEEVSSLKKRLRPHLTALRLQQHQLRDQRRQIEQLQTVLQHTLPERIAQGSPFARQETR